MKEFNIIGDIAGQYNTLLALVEKMPKSATLFSVGDMVDRGKQSRQVVEYVKQNGLAVLGNHEHMMIDACDKQEFYESGAWLYNKGRTTLSSFYPDADVKDYKIIKQLCKDINTDFKEVMDWLKKLPLYHKEEALFISHAPRPAHVKLQHLKSLKSSSLEASLIWNRNTPLRIKNRTQIFGHNSHWGLRSFKDNKGLYAMCIDTSREGVLTGIHWPSMEIFQQKYLD